MTRATASAVLGALSVCAVVLPLACFWLSPRAVHDPELRAFTTDRCSWFPDGPPGDRERWTACCLRHDLAYWQGGTESERRAADHTLRECVAASGNPRFAPLFETAVHVAATPYLPMPFRWSYGWPYTHGYRTLTDSERSRARQLLGEFACDAGGEHASESGWLRDNGFPCPAAP